MRGLFVTGTDTGVGKTIVSASLLAAMSAAGEPVRAYKPVVTGLDDSADAGATTADAGATTADAGPTTGDAVAATADGWPADHVLLGAAAGMAPEDVSPLRFGPAVSPHLAAELAGAPIDPLRLASAATQTADESEQILIVEGVGGLLVPFTYDYSVLELAVALALPLVIAARPRLGTINHTLLTLRVARDAGLDVRAVVLTPWPRAPTALERSNRDTIARIGAIDVEALPHVADATLAELARAGDQLPWRRWL
jgi:dethiobiotin synthetase